MPTYDYRCSTCSERFEVVQSFRDDPLTVCPLTGGPAGCTNAGHGEVKKVFSAPGITFKGDGFYKTDHGSKKSGATSSAGESASTSSSGESSSSSSDSSSSSTATPASTSTSSS